MSAAACALAWFFMTADLEIGRDPRDSRPPVTRSDGFTDRTDCERTARAVERIKPGLLVYEFEPGRRCFQAPAAERGH